MLSKHKEVDRESHHISGTHLGDKWVFPHYGASASSVNLPPNTIDLKKRHVMSGIPTHPRVTQGHHYTLPNPVGVVGHGLLDGGGHLVPPIPGVPHQLDHQHLALHGHQPGVGHGGLVGLGRDSLYTNTLIVPVSVVLAVSVQCN